MKPHRNEWKTFLARGGSGASWTKRWKEKLVAACEYFIIQLMMEDA